MTRRAAAVLVALCLTACAGPADDAYQPQILTGSSAGSDPLASAGLQLPNERADGGNPVGDSGPILTRDETVALVMSLPRNSLSDPGNAPQPGGQGVSATPTQGSAYVPPSAQPDGPTIPTPGGTEWTPPADLPSGQIADLVRAAFPPDQADRAVAIARCESGLRSVVSRPNSNGTRDWGIFQLNDGGTLQSVLRRVGRSPEEIQLALDPTWNIRMAREIWNDRGWQPWTCARILGIPKR